MQSSVTTQTAVSVMPAIGSFEDVTWYRDVFSAIPIPIYTTDRNGTIQLYNPAAAKLWGREPQLGEDMWCGSWRIYEIDGTFLPNSDCPMAMTLRTGVPSKGREVIVERPDGTQTYVTPNAVPIRNSAGEIVGAVNILVDITARKRAELALRDSEEHLRAMFHQAAVGIVVVDPKGRFLQVNDRFCRMLGLTEAEALGQSCEAVTHPEDWPCNWDQLRMLIDGDVPEFNVEKRYRRKDGSYFWVHVTVSPLPDRAGRRTRLIAIVEDIDARKHAEDQVRELTHSLEARVVDRTAQLDAFCYSIAHDLRQYIRGISLNARWVKDLLPHADEEVAGHLDRLVSGAKHMDRLVTDLLGYARSTQQEIRRDPVDVTALATETCEQLRSTYPDASFRIQGRMVALADQAALSVVLLNLIDNACKYAKPGQPADVFVGKDCGTFLVADNGRGFDMSYADKLFEPFQRLHRQEDIAGTGLGLATVKRIVEKHGGRVWAESEPEAGATFYFTLE